MSRRQVWPMTMAPTEPDPYALVVGHQSARAFLAIEAANPVHAYLIVGSSGSGKLDLARAFAADIVAHQLPAEDRERAVRLILSDGYSDVILLGSPGESILIDAARDFGRRSALLPLESPVKVMIGVSMEMASNEVLGTLLKAVEEPGPSTVFILIAESVTPALVTLASRCVRIDAQPLSPEEVRNELLGDPALSSLPSDRIDRAAEESMGDLTRARLLAADERLGVRLTAWADVPGRLDGLGAHASEAAANLVSMVDEAVAPLKAAHAAEAAAAEEEFERFGMRRESKAKEAARHKREVKRFTDGEYRSGLGVMARIYRDAAGTGSLPLATAADAVAALDRVHADSIYNPSWKMQLTALFLRLPPLPSAR